MFLVTSFDVTHGDMCTGSKACAERQHSPGEEEVGNAFAVAGSLAQDLVPDSADQVDPTRATKHRECNHQALLQL